MSRIDLENVYVKTLIKEYSRKIERFIIDQFEMKITPIEQSVQDKTDNLQHIDLTYTAKNNNWSKSGTIKAGIRLTVDLKAYNKWNNFTKRCNIH